MLYIALASFALGVPFVLLPRSIGRGIAIFQKANLKREAEDQSLQARVVSGMREKMRQQFPQFSPHLDDQDRTAKSLRSMGIVFLVQGVAVFIFWVILIKCNGSLG
jgi:hypothetical protein